MSRSEEDMFQDKLLSLSIIIVTYNCSQNLKTCLKSIQQQKYPPEKLEILIIDGGSTDGTPQIARSFGASVHVVEKYRDNQEARRGVGAFLSKNEVLVYIDSDNFLPYNTWLLDMVRPLINDRSIIATQTLRYAYRRSDNLLNRYFSLFGVHDPVAYYLKRMDRLSWQEERWNLYGEVLQDNENYYKVRFDFRSLPTLGCNGFLIYRSLIQRVNTNPENFFHTDIVYDLAKQGYNIYGITKNEIIHYTGSKFITALKKRFDYMRKYWQEMQSKRRYKVYDPSNPVDKMNLIKYTLYSLTVVKPLYDCSRGYLKVKDVAWFIHPLMCINFLVVYSLCLFASTCTIVDKFFSKDLKSSLRGARALLRGVI